MTDFLTQYHIAGLVVGIATFLIIGLFHPIVIKSEYHFGVKSWRAFLVSGVGFAIISFMVDDLFLSTLSGVVSFSCFWSIKEVFEQAKRVKKGWFPANPKRKQ